MCPVPARECRSEDRGRKPQAGVWAKALEQQTATSEILRVISSSPTDLQPVLDAIAASAVRLCDGLFGAVYQFDGQLIHFVAHDGWTDPARLDESDASDQGGGEPTRP